MATLHIASKANQATSIPALLIATLANNKDPNASITIDFQDVETLRSGVKEAVEFVPKSGTSIHGSEHVVSHLAKSYSRVPNDPSPAQKEREDLVCLMSCDLLMKLTLSDQRMVRPNN